MKKTYLFLLVLLVPACKTSFSLLDFEQGWDSFTIEGQENPLHRLEAAGRVLWAADYGSGTLYQSKSKGKNWEKKAALGAEYLEVLQFVDSRHGFTCGDYGFVYKTKDAGETWQEISPPVEGRITEKYRNDPDKDQQPEGLFAAYYGMHFLDKEEGFVSGFSYQPKKGFRDSYRPLLFHTKDAGETWSFVPKEQKEDFFSDFVQHAHPENETINGVYYQNLSYSLQLAKDKERNDIVIRKYSSGSSLDTTYLPLHPFKRGILRHMLFLNENEAYILGGSLDEGNEKAIVYKTVDKGSNWFYIPTNLPHIHGALIQGNRFWISGKEKMLLHRKIR